MNLPDLPDADELERALRIAKGAFELTSRIGQAIGRRRSERAERQVEQILERTGLDDRGLVDRMEADDGASVLVEDAIDAGARTAHDEKRRLLAAVVADALAGGSAPTDHYRQLLRTVADVEPIEVHFLARLQVTADSYPNRPLRAEDVEGWPGDSLLTAPTVAALTRAGLVEDVGSSGGNAAGTGGGTFIGLTRWGEHFYCWLRDDRDAAPYFAPPP